MSLFGNRGLKGLFPNLFKKHVLTYFGTDLKFFCHFCNLIRVIKIHPQYNNTTLILLLFFEDGICITYSL